MERMSSQDGDEQRQNPVPGGSRKGGDTYCRSDATRGINIRELARQGLQEKLRETLSDEEKITLHQRYKQGELSEEVAEVLLGDALEEIEREREAFEEAAALDTTGVFQE